MNELVKPNIKRISVIFIGVNILLGSLYYMLMYNGRECRDASGKQNIYSDFFNGVIGSENWHETNINTILFILLVDLFIFILLTWRYFVYLRDFNKTKNENLIKQKSTTKKVFSNENQWLDSIKNNNSIISNFQTSKEPLNNLFKIKLEQNKSALKTEFTPLYENLASNIDKLINLINSQYDSLNYLKTKVNTIENCAESYGNPQEFSVITKLNINKIIQTIDTVKYINNHAGELFQNHAGGYFANYYYLFNDFKRICLLSKLEETELNNTLSIKSESLDFIKKTHEILTLKGILDLKSIQIKRDKFKDIIKYQDKMNHLTLSRTDMDYKLEECAYVVFNAGAGSTSMLQRRFNLGYSRSGKIINQLEQLGIVGPSNDGKPRELMVFTKAEIEEIFSSIKD